MYGIFGRRGARVSGKKRLLIVLPDMARGGAHAMNFRLAAELIDRGIDVCICVLFDRGDEGDYQHTWPRVPVIRMGAQARAWRVLLLIRLALLARQYKAIMSGMDLAATNYGFLSAILARRPFLAWMHVAFQEHMAGANALDRWLSLAFFRKIQNVVFPSGGALRSLETALGGIPAGKTWEVIENFNISSSGIDTVVGAESELIFDKPVILSIGRLVCQKAYHRLIRAHASLRKCGFDHHLVILGEGDQRASLLAEAESLGVSSSIFLPGHVPHPSAWLSRATVFGLCSEYEGLPLVLLESLEAGIPIVSMDCPAGPGEILMGGEVGMLVPEGAQIAFEAALAQMLESPELRKSYADRGRQRAKYYLPERVIPLWEARIDRLVSNA